MVFAPGAKDPEEIKVLVKAIQPKPFNPLVVSNIELRVDDIAALGVRRISVGGAFALAAWNGFMRAGEILKSEGSFTGLQTWRRISTSTGFLLRTCVRVSIEHELREQNFEIRIETHVLRQLLARSPRAY